MPSAKKKASSSGMKWTKSPEELVASFDAALPHDSRIERRSMFGYPCAFVNGNMFTGLHQDSLIVRLDEADRAKLLALPGARVFEPMPGRPMQAYIVVPAAIVAERNALAGWIKRSLEHAASLPAKAKKPTAASKKATTAKRGAKARA